MSPQLVTYLLCNKTPSTTGLVTLIIVFAPESGRIPTMQFFLCACFILHINMERHCPF